MITRSTNARREAGECSVSHASSYPAGSSHKARAPHAVIIVENMTVPPDRRVWQEARALRADGWRVSVITPKIGSYTAARERIDGIEIYRHPLPIQARSIPTYAAEYAIALLGECRALLSIGINDIDVVQICNPPDFLFLPALVAKKLGRAKVVFDHHDLTPELLAEKMAGRPGASALLAFARWAERRTFRAADWVVSTNRAFANRAIEVGGKSADTISVVYSGPELERLRQPEADISLKKGKGQLLLWVGVMGSQDGLDLLLAATKALKGMPGGDDFHLLIVGDGPERKTTEQQAAQLGLGEDVTFAGFLHGEQLARAFMSADIGVGSDPKTSFNDRLAMNKTMEYMAYGLPIAMFDLDEGQKIAGESALYATANNPLSLAAQLSNLISSPGLRAAKGAVGRARIRSTYSWERQQVAYVEAYRQLIRSA